MARAPRTVEGFTTLDEFLEEEGIAEEVKEMASKRVIALQLAQAMQSKMVSQTELARRLGTSRAQVKRLLDPTSGNVTLDTLDRAARAVGYSLRLVLA